MSDDQQLPMRLRVEMQLIRKAPILTRINGFGWILMGSRDEHAPSGTYVATRVFCALFIPVFRTDAWRVRRLGDREWSFLGKVPLSPLASRLQKAAMIAAFVIIARGFWPAAAPKPAQARTPNAVAEEPVFTRVPLTPSEDREDAPELSAWISTERQALAMLRDSAAAVEVKIAAETARLDAAERQLAALPADASAGPARDRLVGERASAAAALNQLYGSRRMMVARTAQREQELADSVRAFEGR